jgi:hypothetical protein
VRIASRERARAPEQIDDERAAACATGVGETLAETIAILVE